MAQADYVVSNGTGAAVRADLNGQLAAIVTNNSGATSPATTYAYQWWADTTTNTLKLRNSANNAWIEIMQLDGTLTMEDGTAALPGLAFRDDLDTGIFRAGTNQLGISSAGVERVEFGSSEVVFNDSGANYDFRVEGDTNANLFFVDASADAVGIGTTSPDAKLRVVDVNGCNLFVGFSSGVLNYNIYDAAEHLFRSTNGATEHARIDSSGRLLVGTSSSLAPYLAQINFAGSVTNGLLINSSSTSADNSHMLDLVRASTPNNTVPVINYNDATAVRFVLRNNGGLANYQANNVNLSDRNTKKDIGPAADTWNCIKEWEIVNYRYKDQPDDADLSLGVIAQQVAESCPEVITVFQEAKEATEDQPAQEERLGVKEQQMYWMAIKALQEAQVRIEQLEAKVAALESA